MTITTDEARQLLVNAGLSYTDADFYDTALKDFVNNRGLTAADAIGRIQATVNAKAWGAAAREYQATTGSSYDEALEATKRARTGGVLPQLGWPVGPPTIQPVYPPGHPKAQPVLPPLANPPASVTTPPAAAPITTGALGGMGKIGLIGGAVFLLLLLLRRR